MSERGGSPGEFRTTRWSVVLAAQGNDEEASVALNALCEWYWYPIYAFVRSRGHQPPDAEDLTQGFFARLLNKEGIKRARQSGGRLRSFLLRDLQFYLRDEWAKSQTAKRGGGVPHVRIDRQWAEEQVNQLTNDQEVAPEKLFDREWGVALLRATFDQLRKDFSKKKQEAQFDIMKPLITPGEADVSHDDVGERLGLTREAVKSSVYRLRKQFRDILLNLVTETVPTREEAEEELRYLRHLFE